MFRIHPYVVVLLLGASVGLWVFLAVAAVYGPGGPLWQWLLLGALGLYPAVALLRRPFRLQIEGDSLRMRYLLREELIPVTAIVHIWVERVGSVAIVNLGLELHLVDDRRINLSGFDGGVGELANTLIAWRERAMADEPQ